MAIEAKLLPWSIEDIDCGVAACMARCLTSRKGRLDLTGETLGAIEQIRTILAADFHGRFIHLRIVDGKLDYAYPADATKQHVGLRQRGSHPGRANRVAGCAVCRV